MEKIAILVVCGKICIIKQKKNIDFHSREHKKKENFIKLKKNI